MVSPQLLALFALVFCYCLLRWRKRRLDKRTRHRSNDESSRRLTAGGDLEDDDFELVDEEDNENDDDDDPDKLLKWAETNIPNLAEDDEEHKS